MYNVLPYKNVGLSSEKSKSNIDNFEVSIPENKIKKPKIKEESFQITFEQINI